MQEQLPSTEASQKPPKEKDLSLHYLHNPAYRLGSPPWPEETQRPASPPPH